MTKTGLPLMRHPADARIHFSELKQHAKSPAHVKLATEGARSISDVMRIGGVADSIVFQHGKGHVLYPGRRAGKEWESFQAEHPDTYIVIQSELDRAEGAAHAVLTSPAAMRVLGGCDFQQVMQWDAFGLPCAAGVKGQRGGFDALHRAKGELNDLKVTSCTEPEALSRHALNQLWHAQMAWYRWGARSLGQTINVCRLVCVESSPPHNVTVLRLPESWLVIGEKLITAWCDRHRACECAGAWPGYVQEEIEAIDPAWMAEGVDLVGLDEAPVE